MCKIVTKSMVSWLPPSKSGTLLFISLAWPIREQYARPLLSPAIFRQQHERSTTSGLRSVGVWLILWTSNYEVDVYHQFLGKDPTKHRLFKPRAVLTIFNHGPKPSKQRISSRPRHQTATSTYDTQWISTRLSGNVCMEPVLP